MRDGAVRASNRYGGGLLIAAREMNKTCSMASPHQLRQMSTLSLAYLSAVSLGCQLLPWGEVTGVAKAALARTFAMAGDAARHGMSNPIANRSTQRA